MVVDKKSPRHPGFPPASSLQLLETAVMQNPGWGKGHPWLSSSCKLRNCSLLLSCRSVTLQAGKAAEMAVSSERPCTDSPLLMEVMAQRFTPAKSFEACLLKANLFLFQKVLIIEKPGFCWLISIFSLVLYCSSIYFFLWFQFLFLFPFDSSFLEYYAHNLSSSIQKKKYLAVTCVTQKLWKDAKCREHRKWKKNTDIFILFSFSVYVEFLMLLKKSRYRRGSENILWKDKETRRLSIRRLTAKI